MFPFFSSKKKRLLTQVDLHSHLIPGIDDGVKDMDLAIELVSELQLLGYEKLILTPHVSDMFPNTKATILEGYEGLKRVLRDKGIMIEIEVAAEYYADESFDLLLEQRDLLTFGTEQYLLFELSYFTPPMDMDNLVYEIFRAGYRPVLAHPERYLYWHDDLPYYEVLKEMGVLFQINLNSTVGYYNEAIQHTVEYLIKKGMVDFIGSDMHHKAHLRSLKRSLLLSSYKKIFKYNNILNNSCR